MNKIKNEGRKSSCLANTRQYICLRRVICFSDYSILTIWLGVPQKNQKMISIFWFFCNHQWNSKVKKPIMRLRDQLLIQKHSAIRSKFF